IFLSLATAHPTSYTLSLHDALPIFLQLLQARTLHLGVGEVQRSELLEIFQLLQARIRHLAVVEVHPDHRLARQLVVARDLAAELDRKSTRLNSSHLVISYAVFCLKK